MSHSFDLIDNPWIMCSSLTGDSRELGLSDIFQQAHILRDISDQSPLVVAALYRLLLAILHRAINGPPGDDAWHQLWHAARLPIDSLEQYLALARKEQWFDLLHPERPFYQTPRFTTASPSGINRLAQELARGNNATLFDHTDDTNPPAIGPAQAARYLIAEQSFAVGGGKSVTGNTTHAPLVSGTAVFLTGRSLKESLLLNLVTYDGAEKPFGDAQLAASEPDLPFWERNGKAGPLERLPGHPRGYLDLLTWQSRTLRFQVEEVDTAAAVRYVHYAQGRRFNPSVGFRDPVFAIRRDIEKAPSKDIGGDRPIRLVENRALWRDSAALFEFGKVNEFIGPLALEQLAERRVGASSVPAVCDTSIVGLCTDKAKVNFWRHEHLPVPLHYLRDKDKVRELKRALQMSEKVALALRMAIRTAVRAALSPQDPNKADKDRVANLSDSLAPERVYWPRLDAPFRQLIIRLSQAAQPEPELIFWFRDVLKPAALHAFSHTAGALDASARALRASVEGESSLRLGLSMLEREFKLSPPMSTPDQPKLKETAHAEP